MGRYSVLVVVVVKVVEADTGQQALEKVSGPIRHALGGWGRIAKEEVRDLDLYQRPLYHIRPEDLMGEDG